MSNIPTWNAILQQWPWFAAAAGVFVVAVGLLVALKPKSTRQSETAGIAPDTTKWTLTERIDFTDDRAAGDLVLQVEESRSTIGSTGLEHREIRWRKGTVEEAKKVLKSYNAQYNLAMAPTFAVSAAERAAQSKGDRLIDDTGSSRNGQDMTEATLVPYDRQH
jgi:hypothetical protein